MQFQSMAMKADNLNEIDCVDEEDFHERSFYERRYLHEAFFEKRGKIFFKSSRRCWKDNNGELR